MNIHRLFSFIVAGSLAIGSGTVLGGRAAPTPSAPAVRAAQVVERNAAGVALPAGVSAEWWATVQEEIRGGTEGVSAMPDWTAEGDQAGALFGYSVGSAGDVNGDGYADVIVGAPSYTNGQDIEGRAFAYHGSATGLSTTADWTAESDQVFANFGYSAGTAGDVNADGYADVIVGAYSYDNGQTDEGRAFVYLGSASGLSATADWTAEGEQASAYFGVSVGSAGDVNGDGFADVIVGAYSYDNGQVDEGRAFVYHGSAAGLSTVANWTAESDQVFALFGYSVGTAGDVNGDGYAEVTVGASQYTNGQSAEGRAFVYHGSAAGLSTIPNWTAESDQAFAYFGHSAGTAGDVNGDGYADVIVGANYYDNGQMQEGRAFVYHGSASGLSTSANWRAESNQDDAYFGYSVGTAGDVNGDGYADVIVGARFYDNGQFDEGRAFVYHGSAAGLSASADWTAESDQAAAQFGISVGTAGDVNGDGYADVIVGAWGYDNGQTDEGQAYVYHGPDLGGGISIMAAWRIRMNFERFNPDEVTAVVHVGEPDAHLVVPGATVEVTFDLPDGITSMSAVTDSKGRAYFRVATAGGGTCTVTIDDIAKDGYAWDAELGVVRERISCP